jgi:hypothetical protein
MSRLPLNFIARVALLAALLLVYQPKAHAGAAESCPVLPSNATVQWTYVLGPDFYVCYVTRPHSESKLFGVYLGCCPDFHEKTLKRIGPGNVAGIAVTWFEPDPDAKVGPFSRQTVIALPSRYRYMAHVWIIADTQEELQQALSTLEKIQFRASLE